jgi:hypothetical protein
MINSRLTYDWDVMVKTGETIFGEKDVLTDTGLPLLVETGDEFGPYSSDFMEKAAGHAFDILSTYTSGLIGELDNYANSIIKSAILMQSQDNTILSSIQNAKSE